MELLQIISYFIQPCFLIAVTVHCKDTRIVVNVNTNRAFSGRIYALGRSETCNVDVINSDSFRLDLTMSGQDCNTQSAVGRFFMIFCIFELWLNNCISEWRLHQHCGGATPQCRHDQNWQNLQSSVHLRHNIQEHYFWHDANSGPRHDKVNSLLLMKYKINFIFNFSKWFSITSAPEAPAPRISIVDQRGQEVETVRIGDRLTFKIEIPDKTPYGIFARSCVAMAKDSRQIKTLTKIIFMSSQESVYVDPLSQSLMMRVVLLTLPYFPGLHLRALLWSAFMRLSGSPNLTVSYFSVMSNTV